MAAIQPAPTARMAGVAPAISVEEMARQALAIACDVGVEELDVGDVGEVPVFPVLPLEPLLLDEEIPPLEPVLPEPDEVDPDVAPCRDVLLAPGWTWATTNPITAVAPVAARMAARVSWRSRD